jgi:glutamate synthase domain-containing protein 3
MKTKNGLKFTKNCFEFAIDSKNLGFKDLNFKIKDTLKNVAIEYGKFQHAQFLTNKIEPIIILKNVLGQRYIGDGIKAKARIKIYGTPGNDLAAFMDGPEIEVFGNGQDGIGNTMNSGTIIIHGDCGDIAGYSMRGGEIYIKGDVGYRSGINMKSYIEKIPVIIIGGTAGNFLGEYMAGGIIIVLGLENINIRNNISNKNTKNREDIKEDINKKNDTNTEEFMSFPVSFHASLSKTIVGDYVGAGMHGGVIYIRGEIEDYKLGREVKKEKIDNKDKEILNKYINNFCSYFDVNTSEILNSDYKDFIKLVPYSHRPYGKLYAY